MHITNHQARKTSLDLGLDVHHSKEDSFVVVFSILSTVTRSELGTTLPFTQSSCLESQIRIYSESSPLGQIVDLTYGSSSSGLLATEDAKGKAVQCRHQTGADGRGFWRVSCRACTDTIDLPRLEARLCIILKGKDLCISHRHLQPEVPLTFACRQETLQTGELPEDSLPTDRTIRSVIVSDTPHRLHSRTWFTTSV